MIVDKDQLQPYIDGDATLMPLHKWDKVISKTTKKGEEKLVYLGKTPNRNGWRSYAKEDITKSALQGAKLGCNVGVRLESQDLIVDVDPRNGGLESLPKLLEVMSATSLEDLMDTYPTVITGGGGWHFYMTKPADVKVVASLVSAGMPGIDLKTEGGYVVAAGSKHDKIDAFYKWETENLGPSYADRPEAPTKLLTLAEKKEAEQSQGSDTPGELKPKHLKALLDQLDILDYKDGNLWFEIMSASHHGTDGEGIEEFLEWCLGDPDYSEDEHVIRTRWHSLGKKDGPKFRAGTLYRAVKNAGGHTNVTDAQDDFEDLEDLDNIEGEDDLLVKDRPVSKVARELAEEITWRLSTLLGMTEESDPEEMLKISARDKVIDRMVKGSFWSGSKSKLFLLSHREELLQFPENKAYDNLTEAFGNVIDVSAVKDMVLQMSFGGEPGSLAEEDRRAKHLVKCLAVPKEVVIKHLMFYSQREAVEWSVDMFSKRARLKLIEDKVKIVLTHKEFKVPGVVDQEVINDYKKHFPRFDEFLSFLVASRFAVDRKKAYLWILADSDWGKGLLIEGVLGSLGAEVETSVKEIEAMFEGRPVGRSPEEFKRAFALVVNEFKTVKSEIKQLESSITLSPKHQLSASVEVFAKVFTSAESVRSLVTENGVEDQFANRMSIFQETGTIESRAVWKKKGKFAYRDSLISYAATRLNEEVEQMRKLGKQGAHDAGDRYLDEFIKRNGLGTLFTRFSESIPGIAQDVIDWLHNPNSGTWERGTLMKNEGESQWYLTSPRKEVGRYLEAHCDKNEYISLDRRKLEIISYMSGDGKGLTNYRIKGIRRKAISLLPPRNTEDDFES